MVRNMVGTLLEAGKGNISEDRLLQFFSGPQSKAGPTAPPGGLFLKEVFYSTMEQIADPVRTYP